MSAVSAGLTIAGVLFNLAGAVWLLLGFSPDDDRYTKGVGFDGDLPAVSNLLRDQRRVSGFVVLGTTMQLLALVLVVTD